MVLADASRVGADEACLLPVCGWAVGTEELRRDVGDARAAKSEACVVVEMCMTRQVDYVMGA